MAALHHSLFAHDTGYIAKVLFLCSQFFSSTFINKRCFKRHSLLDVVRRHGQRITMNMIAAMAA